MFTTSFIEHYYPVMIPKLHLALKAEYGSDCARNLNCLSTLLRKLAITDSGLTFLLKCRGRRVFPAFISRSVKFVRTGRHLERLAEKLPTRMLRAAIRDLRSRLASLQKEVDSVWVRLFSIVTDVALWNGLVQQKDSLFASILATSTLRLRHKFTGLFHPNFELADPYCIMRRVAPIGPSRPDASAVPSEAVASVPSSSSVLASESAAPTSGRISNDFVTNTRPERSTVRLDDWFSFHSLSSEPVSESSPLAFRPAVLRSFGGAWGLFTGDL